MLHMKEAGVDPYLRLLDATRHTEPECADDPRYITDRPDLEPGDRETMAAICAACPLLAPCAEFAQAAEPPAGWWPGHNLRIRKARAA